MEKISIIIPCYNVQKYIEQCLNSIAHQTYTNLEIICINDGSADDTLKIIKEFQKKDDRVYLIDQSNKGLSESRNMGIQNSTGRYIMFVDSDDWLELDTIEYLLNQQKDYDVICFSYFRNFKNVKIPKKFNFEGAFSADFLQRKIVGPIDKELADAENLDALITVWGKLYRADKIKTNSFVDVSEIGTWEDGLFNLNVLKNCENVLIIDKPFYHYRKDNLQSFTSVAKKDLYKKWLIKFEKISNIIINKNSDYQIALQNRIAFSVLGLALTEMNSSSSLLEKNKKLSIILSEPVYRDALECFELKYLPIHWRLFYWFAKNKMSSGILFLTRIIQMIQKMKNI